MKMSGKVILKYEMEHLGFFHIHFFNLKHFVFLKLKDNAKIIFKYFYNHWKN